MGILPKSWMAPCLYKPVFYSVVSLIGVQAAYGKGLSEEAYLSEVPVVLSVSRLAQPVSEAPGPITVIDRDMIKASGARDLVDVFRLVPGFYVGYASGNTDIVSYHGLADQYARRMQVLIDRRSVYTPLFGGVEWSDLPVAMEDIDRIEVVRGPNAASYGPNSFLGVINIITRHPSQDRGLKASASYGNTGIRDGYMRYNGVEGDLSYRLTLAYLHDDGFEGRNDGRSVRMMTGRMDYRINDRDQLQVQLGYNGGPRDQGRYDKPLDDPARERANISNFQQIRWQRVVGPDEEISLQFYQNYHRASEPFAFQILPLPPLPVDYNAVADRQDIEFQHTLSPVKSLRVVWGLEHRLDSVRSPTYLGTGNDVKSHLSRVFGNGEWHITQKLIMNTGAMAEKNDLTGTAISPRLSFNYLISPEHTLRAGVSKATRTPTLLEDRVDYKINYPPIPVTQLYLSQGNLGPERVTSREIAYLGQYPKLRMSAEMRFFDDTISDLISTYTNTSNPNNATDFRNGDRIQLTGGELQFTYRPARDSQFTINMAHTAAHAQTVDLDYASSVPQNTLSIIGMHRFSGNIYASAIYHQFSAVKPLAGDQLGTTRRMDVRVSKKFNLSGSKAELALVLQNILDQYYEYRAASSINNNFDTRGYVKFSIEY